MRRRRCWKVGGGELAAAVSRPRRFARDRDRGVDVSTVERATAQPIGATLTTYSNQPVFGRTRYHEAYEIRLMSLEPRR